MTVQRIISTLFTFRVDFQCCVFLPTYIRTECSEHVNSFIDANWAYVRINVLKKTYHWKTAFTELCAFVSALYLSLCCCSVHCILGQINLQSWCNALKNDLKKPRHNINYVCCLARSLKARSLRQQLETLRSTTIYDYNNKVVAACLKAEQQPKMVWPGLHLQRFKRIQNRADWICTGPFVYRNLQESKTVSDLCQLKQLLVITHSQQKSLINEHLSIVKERDIFSEIVSRAWADAWSDKEVLWE